MSARFAHRDAVRVMTGDPPHHVRTPTYLKGRTGTVTQMVGAFRNPETLAHGGDGLPRQPLYRVRFGLPPAWYKSTAYRARAVREPRALLAEFGTAVAEETEVRVHDSTAELRYLVLPLRPEGTAGLAEDALAGLVGRDAMIGVATVRADRPA